MRKICFYILIAFLLGGCARATADVWAEYSGTVLYSAGPEVFPPLPPPPPAPPTLVVAEPEPENGGETYNNPSNYEDYALATGADGYEAYEEYYAYDYCELEYDYYELPPAERRPMIALTFDDGPSYYTIEILELLAAVGGRATFCVLGYRLEEWEDVIHMIAAGGSEVIGHSWYHHRLPALSREDIEWNITGVHYALADILGTEPPRIFRAPFGAVYGSVRQVAHELDFAILNWTIDPRDWEDRDHNRVAEHILARPRDGQIILLHDVHHSTLVAMRRVIPALDALGFQLVTATYLIEYFEGPLVGGTEYRGIR